MTIEQKYIDLINAEIDGEISADDKALLDDFVAGNSKAKSLRDELAGVCHDLDSLEQLSPPSSLQHLVMQRVGARKNRLSASKSGGVTEMLAGLFGFPAIRYSLSFAAGIVVAISLISSDQGSRQAFNDVTGLVGTMSDMEVSGGIAAQDDMSLALNELAGSVSLGSVGSLLILDFDLASQGPVEIVAAFDDRDIWFNGFAQLESPGTSVAAETGQVRVRMEGQRRYAVYLNNTGQTAATVTLRFYSSGQLLHEGELSFGEKK